MMEQLASSLGSLAGATIGRRSALVASAVQLEAGEREGTRVKPALLEGHSNEGTPYGKARVRHFGNTVQMFGAVFRTYSADKTLAFELPEEVRPNRAVEMQVLLDPAVEESCEGMVFVSPEGKVELLSLARFSVFNPAPEGQTFMLNGLSYEIKEEQ